MSLKLSQIKIIFFGTPEFAAEILKSLIDNKFDIAAVFAQPDKKIGRQQEIVFSPVKKLALENKIKVFQPESLRDENHKRGNKKYQTGSFHRRCVRKNFAESYSGNSEIRSDKYPCFASAEISWRIACASARSLPGKKKRESR